MVDPVIIGRREAERRPRPLLRRMIGDVLRRTRLEQRRTLADVSRAARVSLPYLSEVERGRKEASSEVLAAICDALHIDLSDLLAGVGRDLVGDRARTRIAQLETVRLETVRLETVRNHRASPQVRGPGDVVCLLAA
jgi:transcriptional regulator with XRE-family HTH domain